MKEKLEIYLKQLHNVDYIRILDIEKDGVNLVISYYSQIPEEYMLKKTIDVWTVIEYFVMNTQPE